MVPPLRIELSHPGGNGFTARCVSQLARTANMVRLMGFEPTTYRLKGGYSSN